MNISYRTSVRFCTLFVSDAPNEYRALIWPVWAVSCGRSTNTSRGICSIFSVFASLSYWQYRIMSVSIEPRSRSTASSR